MSFLTEELGLPGADVQKILIRSPKILSYGVESLRDKQRYLEEGLQLSAKDVSENDTMNARRGWFDMGMPLGRSFASSTDSFTVGVGIIMEVCVLRFCSSNPRQSVIPILRCFWSMQVSSLVSRCPQLLGYGVDAMESKVVFLEKVGYKTTGPRSVLVALAHDDTLRWCEHVVLHTECPFHKLPKSPFAPTLSDPLFCRNCVPLERRRGQSFSSTRKC